MMTPRERLCAVLRGEKPDKIPFVDYISPKIGAKMMGILGEKKTDLLTIARRTHCDTVVYYEPSAPCFANMIPNPEGEEDLVGEGLIKTMNDLDKMKFPNPRDPSYYDSYKRFIEEYGQSEIAVTAHIRNLGAFSTIYSIGLQEFSIAQFRNKALIIAVMDKYVEWNRIVMETLESLGGTDFYTFPNDISLNTGPMILPQLFKEIFVPRIKQILEVVKTPWAFHSDGEISELVEDILSLNPVVLNPIDPNSMDIYKFKKEYGHRVVLWGNLDVNLLTYGTEDEVRMETRKLLKEIGYDGRYIFASGNSIPDYCNPHSVLAMCDEFEKHRDLN